MVKTSVMSSMLQMLPLDASPDKELTAFTGFPVLNQSNNKLAQHFPIGIKIYEYNALTDTKTFTTLDKVKDWLLAKENGSFVFQCLFCYQEMDFRTVFWKGDSSRNRSHMFTNKHKNKTQSVNAVGLLFNSTKKFIMCSESTSNAENLFERMELVARQPDRIFKNPSILSQVFCDQFKLYTFDKEECSLVELKSNVDLVLFMKNEVKPLFRFYCMYCSKSGKSYTKVIKHLASPKHINRMPGKGAILSIRDFNIFLICSLNKLTSLMYFKHENSFLEEIIISSDGCVIISGVCKKENKKSALIKSDFKPIMLPDKSFVKNESIRIRIPYKAPTESYDLENSLSKLHINYEKSVTIYEFSDDILKDNQAENLIHSVLSDGCRIWCSRCSTAMYTLDEIEDHLKSETHISRIRNNELVGFMCYSCKVFFIDLKGDTLPHMHGSTENKKILKLVGSTNKMIAYDTPLNKCISLVYSSELNSLQEVCKYMCLCCYDLTKKKLSHLPIHEKTEQHLKSDTNKMFSLCEFCNVIYIDSGNSYSPSRFFKEHFVSHLDLKDDFEIKMWCVDTSTEECQPFSLKLHSGPEKVITDLDALNSRLLQVRGSRVFCQIEQLGISFKEFQLSEEWTLKCFYNYVSLFPRSSSGVLGFTCLKCKNRFTSIPAAGEHCFMTCTQLNTSVNYMKFCIVCNELYIASGMEDIQEHFLNEDHVSKLLSAAGIRNVDITVKPEEMTNCRYLFPSQECVNDIVNEKVHKMRVLFQEKKKNTEIIRRDCLTMLQGQFPTAEVLFYGSQMASLSFEESDFDVCLNVGINHFDLVKELLEKSRSFDLLNSIPQARKPILRVTNISTGFKCDICLSLTWEEHYARLIKAVVYFDEKIHWLLAGVHTWARLTKLRGPHCMNSPSLTWLVLFYAMQPDVRLIPCIGQIFDSWGGRENILKKEIILTWPHRRFSGPQKSKMELLEGFFNYYSLMNFSKYTLCPSTGHVLPRSAAESGQWYIKDPFHEGNSLEHLHDDACRRFQTMCYLMLNMPWRIC